jgi:hypothetical protein
MIANPCFHCWCDAKRLVNPAEIVVHVMERDRRLKIPSLPSATAAGFFAFTVSIVVPVVIATILAAV